MNAQQAILCVDDERSILTALQQQIMRAFSDSYVLEFAESGEEAIELILELQSQGISIAAVLTDEMMPGMKGHELIERISELSKGTLCILLTGYAQTEVMDHIKGNNLASCISKPWDSRELIELVQSALNKRK